MADILITYDVSDKNKEMKVALKALGYMDNWKSNEQTYYLPNTTMWKKDTTVSQGIEDMQACM